MVALNAKLYTIVLNRRLVRYCDKTGCIEEEQAGFQRKYACIDQAFVLNSIVRNRLQEGKGTYALFIDMQKCFDWVDRDLLLYRLLNQNITGKFYHSIKALYNTSASTIRINNIYTNQFQIKVGVTRGEDLSPHLCTLFLSNLSEVIKKAKLGIPCGNLMVSLLLCVEHTVIFAENPDNRQHLLDILGSWCHKWLMYINLMKTKIIHFLNGRQEKTSCKVQVPG